MKKPFKNTEKYDRLILYQKLIGFGRILGKGKRLTG
jgi:hypothetical protein